MKIAFFSDIHGNIYSFEKFLIDIHSNEIDYLFFCGDIFGYYYYQNEILDCLRKNGELCKCILGNHDKMFLDLLEDKLDEESLILNYGNSYKGICKKISQENIDFLKSVPSIRYFNIQGQKIAITHGSLSDNLNGRIYPNTAIDSEDLYKQYDYVILGHTHHKMVRTVGETYIINPGSIGQQRDGKGCSYLVLDLDNGYFNFKTIEYDVQRLVMDIDKKDNGNYKLKEVLTRRRD